MDLLDVIIILLFLTALMRGAEVGIIRQLFSTVGLFLGLFVGVFIQGKLIHYAHTPISRALLALAVISIAVGLLLGMFSYIGVFIRQGLERAKRLKILDTLDLILGGSVAGLTLLGAVWLSASLFNNVPSQTLQRQLHNSVIIEQLDKSLPPVPNIVARLGQLIDPNDYPDVFTGLEPAVNANTPLPSISGLSGAVQQDRISVVKIEGNGCGGITQGTGFIASNNLVITNAHVVAGVAQPFIIDSNGEHAATVIEFDPNLDIAVLRANHLAGSPLKISAGVADKGTLGAILGYPGGGGLNVQPSSVLDSFMALGRNIYNQGNTERQVYSLEAIVRPGNSGSPLINKNGQVFGVVFAESTNYNNVGYALTMSRVAQDLNQVEDSYQAVGTGSCAQ